MRKIYARYALLALHQIAHPRCKLCMLSKYSITLSTCRHLVLCLMSLVRNSATLHADVTKSLTEELYGFAYVRRIRRVEASSEVTNSLLFVRCRWTKCDLRKIHATIEIHNLRCILFASKTTNYFILFLVLLLFLFFPRVYNFLY